MAFLAADIPDEVMNKIENWLDQLAMELVLAEPDKDKGQLPVRDILHQMKVKSSTVEDLVHLTQAASYGTNYMDAIMDELRPFSRQDLNRLSGLLEQLKMIAADPSLAFDMPDDAKEFQEKAQTPRVPVPSVVETNIEPELVINLNVDSDGDLLREFINESHEHLDNIEQGVLVLESNPEDDDTLNSIFRAFHTFKGGSGFLNLIPINRLSHELETLLDLARTKKLAISSDVINVILAGADTLKDFVAQMDLQLSGKQPLSPICIPIRELAEHVKGMVSDCGSGIAIRPYTEGTPAPVRSEAPGAQPSAKASVAATVEEDDDEPSASVAKAAAHEPAKKPNTQQQAAAQGQQNASVVKVDTIKLDSLIDLVGELVIAQSQVAQDEELSKIESQKLNRNLAQLGRITNDLQRVAMSLRMVPIRATFQKMNRLVRDLAARIGKQIDFQIAGEDTEMDRTIVEELSDPLMHMIRNSVDHGIEMPDVRTKAGKKPCGTVNLSSYHQGGNIVIDIRDDGGGLNKERILRKAVERGIVTPEQNLSEKEIFALIFAPGFSTAEQVTDISGRGVGMDVVRKNIEKLRGKIEIDSVQGQGTTFRIFLPLTLAIIDGLIVKVGEQRYIIPTLAVRESFRPTKEMISTVHERGEMVNVRGRLNPLLRLYDVFGVTPRSTDVTDSIVLVVESAHETRCVLVDDLLSKQEVVIKSLGEQFKQNKSLAGAAILGDGTVGLILDPSALVQLDFNALADAA